MPPASIAHRAPLAVIVLLVTASTGASLALPGVTAGELLVGFEGPIDLALVKRVGGTVLRTFDAIDVAQIKVTDLGLATTLLNAAPNVAFVESNDALRLSGSWNGASWSAASWDAASWDAASWDAASWDAASWDAASWDAASWDASSWDAASWDAASWDAASWDAASWDAASWDAASWDGTAMDAGFDVQWGLGAARFPAAWTIERGSGRAAVCVLDTGVDATHPDLKGRVVRHASGAYGVDARLGKKDPRDDVGHGTHVAGIVGAIAGNGVGVAGGAREPIVNVKVMGKDGGKEADLAAGLLACAATPARVASMSLHIDKASPTVERAVREAQANGILLVAATGNDGASSVRYPAAYAGVVAVGAHDPAAKRAPFSNYGSRLDLVAPGVKIASTLSGGKYAIGSGTSQAAPFVAAAAALVRDVNPSLTAPETRAILLATANDVGAVGPDAATGRGALDAGAAVASAAGGSP